MKQTSIKGFTNSNVKSNAGKRTTEETKKLNSDKTPGKTISKNKDKMEMPGEEDRGTTKAKKKKKPKKSSHKNRKQKANKDENTNAQRNLSNAFDAVESKQKEKLEEKNQKDESNQNVKEVEQNRSNIKRSEENLEGEVKSESKRDVMAKILNDSRDSEKESEELNDHIWGRNSAMDEENNHEPSIEEEIALTDTPEKEEVEEPETGKRWRKLDDKKKEEQTEKTENSTTNRHNLTSDEQKEEGSAEDDVCSEATYKTNQKSDAEEDVKEEVEQPSNKETTENTVQEEEDRTKDGTVPIESNTNHEELELTEEDDNNSEQTMKRGQGRQITYRDDQDD